MASNVDLGAMESKVWFRIQSLNHLKLSKEALVVAGIADELTGERRTSCDNSDIATQFRYVLSLKEVKFSEVIRI